MRTVNKVILIGNVAKDPLVRTTLAGAKSALFVVATNRVYKDKSGVPQSEAEFSNCIAWGPLADRCEQFLKKGKLVYVEGALSRLLVSVEAYPTLTATQGFRDLQSQLEGTENRIAVSRGDYNGVANTWNVKVMKFPTVFIARLLGFDKAALFDAQPGSENAPKVEFK